MCVKMIFVLHLFCFSFVLNIVTLGTYIPFKKAFWRVLAGMYVAIVVGEATIFLVNIPESNFKFRPV
jgi:hypothetical protein